MRDCPWVPETKRQFIRDHRKRLRLVRKLLWSLHAGCEMLKHPTWGDCLKRIEIEVDEIDARTKPYS